MSLSKKQQAYLDRRHATALILLNTGHTADELHRHTVASLKRRGFLQDSGRPTYEGLKWYAAYVGPLEPFEYVKTACSVKRDTTRRGA